MSLITYPDLVTSSEDLRHCSASPPLIQLCSRYRVHCSDRRSLSGLLAQPPFTAVHEPYSSLSCADHSYLARSLRSSPQSPFSAPPAKRSRGLSESWYLDRDSKGLSETGHYGPRLGRVSQIWRQFRGSQVIVLLSVCDFATPCCTLSGMWRRLSVNVLEYLLLIHLPTNRNLITPLPDFGGIFPPGSRAATAGIRVLNGNQSEFEFRKGSRPSRPGLDPCRHSRNIRKR